MKSRSGNTTQSSRVWTGSNSLKELHKVLILPAFSEAKLFVLADSNTIDHCFPLLESMVKLLKKAKVIEIPAGEENKDIEVCRALWLSLARLGADRNSVLLNLGGGVVTDIGGFVASTYMRGIRYFNIPTSLLGMVDAAIGGKTGIDLDGIKNMVGAFHMPAGIFIYPAFIETLPEIHIRNGYAEMLKHALIADEDLWDRMKSKPLPKTSNWLGMIKRSVEIKQAIIDDDPYEKDLRKMLNFGHTIGHAVESYCLRNSRKHILHGEAIACGMICETYLSNKILGFPDDKLEEITGYVLAEFPYVRIKGAFDELIQLMRSDKKNANDAVNFTLLADIGRVVINQKCTENVIIESLRFYNDLSS